MLFNVLLCILCALCGLGGKYAIYIETNHSVI
jgi:hypothetical protein